MLNENNQYKYQESRAEGQEPRVIMRKRLCVCLRQVLLLSKRELENDKMVRMVRMVQMV